MLVEATAILAIEMTSRSGLYFKKAKRHNITYFRKGAEKGPNIDIRNKPGIQTYMNATTDHTVQWTDRKLSEKLSRSNKDKHTAVPTVVNSTEQMTTANKV